MSEADLVHLIQSRRTIRRFSDRQVSMEDLQALVAAAIWAPSGSNQQELRYFVTANKEDVATVNLCKRHIANPQAVILIYAYLGEDYYRRRLANRHTWQLPYLDAGASIQNMLLCAHAKGLGACWLNLSPYWDRGGELLFKRFFIGPEYRLISGVLLGYPEEVVNLETVKHLRRPVMRRPVPEYLVEPPRRITVLGMASRSSNLGSRAYSAGLQALITEEHPDAQVSFLESPVGLERYNFGQLRASGSAAPDKLDAWAQEIVGTFRRQEAMAAPLLSRGVLANIARTKLVLGNAPVLKRWLGARWGTLPRWYSRAIRYDPFFVGKIHESDVQGLPLKPLELSGEVRRKVRRYPFWLRVVTKPIRMIQGHLQSLRTWVRFQRPYAKDYAARLKVLESSFLVVYNGDGMVADIFADEVVRQLLELRVAQLLGCRVVSINQSIAVNDPVLRSVLAKVYRELDQVMVREPISTGPLLEMGIAEQKIEVTADTALLVTPADADKVERIVRAEEIEKGVVGVAIRGDRPVDFEGWAPLIIYLKQRLGKQVLFISNCLKVDRKVGEELQRRHGIRVLSSQYDYPEYIGLVSRLELVISERYHTNVFSLMGQIPFVPLVGNTFKTNGFVQLADYPVPVLDTAAKGWADEAIKWVQYAYDNYETIRETLAKSGTELRESARLNAHWDILPAMQRYLPVRRRERDGRLATVSSEAEEEED